MKCKIHKTDILNILSKVQGIAGRKTSLAITTNILLRAEGSGISIAATDLETGFEGYYAAEVETDGVIAINARKFFEIVREFPSDVIQLQEAENHGISIFNESVEYHLVGMNPEDFPEIPRLEDIDFFDMPAASLGDMIEKSIVIGGASEDKRAHITGIFMESLERDGRPVVRMVSTDGSRLSSADHVFEEGARVPKFESFIIPKKGLNEVSKFLMADSQVRVGVKENNFIVKSESETVIIRLLEGDFPEYRDILKKGGGTDIHLNKERFLRMLKRMSILSSDDYKGVIFRFEESRITVTSTNPDLGESKESMEIEYGGEKVEVAFNPRYLMETLGVTEEDGVVLHLISDEKPCIVTPKDNENFITVIMPMRI